MHDLGTDKQRGLLSDWLICHPSTQTLLICTAENLANKDGIRKSDSCLNSLVISHPCAKNKQAKKHSHKNCYHAVEVRSLWTWTLIFFALSRDKFPPMPSSRYIRPWMCALTAVKMAFFWASKTAASSGKREQPASSLLWNFNGQPTCGPPPSHLDPRTLL